MYKNKILYISKTKYHDHFLFFMLLILVLFSSCATVGPDYSPPAIEVPDNWQTGLSENLPAATDKGIYTKWWESFNDPILSDLITRAVSNNLSIKEAVTRITEARARRGIAAADEYPSVSSSASATKSHTSGVSNKSYQMGIDSSWEIDLFGGIKRSVEASDADIESANESLKDVIISLTAEVALNYVQLRLYQSQLDVTLSNLKSQEETNEIVTWRYQAGLVTELDLQNSESTLEQTRSLLPDLQSNIAQAQHKIAVLLGVNPGALKQELSKAMPIPVLKDEIKTGIPADILRQRPDLRKAERDLAAQTARIGVAVSDLYPKITLSGSIQVQSPSTGSLLSSDSLSSSIGPSISWQVFRAGAIKQNIEIQSTLADRLLIQYKALVLSALEEVEDAMSSCLYDQMKRESLKKAVNAASRSLELSRMQYSSGLVDFQVLLESERTLLSLQDQLTQNEGQITIDYISLYKALGGGWSSDSTEDTTRSKS
jgi:multidrug efflux system outer membrane protein